MKLAAESDQLYNNVGDDLISLDHCPGTRFNFSDISVSSVALSLRNLKASKATGVENIPAKTSQSGITHHCAIVDCYI